MENRQLLEKIYGKNIVNMLQKNILKSLRIQILLLKAQGTIVVID